MHLLWDILCKRENYCAVAQSLGNRNNGVMSVTIA